MLQFFIIGNVSAIDKSLNEIQLFAKGELKNLLNNSSSFGPPAR